MNRTALFASLVIASLYTPGAARAETINCTNITSLPTVITTQGVYCLKQDLSTSLASGAAITIGTNNVTIDCNGYKLGGLAAGPNTRAAGIRAQSRLNASVRNCNIRGFYFGVQLGEGGGGHVVEDNRLDGITGTGIVLTGDGSVVRRNRVFDTGGEPEGIFRLAGIYAAGTVDIIENTVAGVFGKPGGNQGVAGIVLEGGSATVIRGNRVRDIAGSGSGSSHGISGQNNYNVLMIDNHLANQGHGTGIECVSNASKTVLTGNHVLGFTTSFVACAVSSGNLTY